MDTMHCNSRTCTSLHSGTWCNNWIPFSISSAFHALCPSVHTVDLIRKTIVFSVHSSLISLTLSQLVVSNRLFLILQNVITLYSFISRQRFTSRAQFMNYSWTYTQLSSLLLTHKRIIIWRDLWTLLYNFITWSLLYYYKSLSIC